MADVLDAVGVDVVGPGPVTFFAPSDRAFLALDADLLASLLADDDQLVALIRGHLLDGPHAIDELADASPVVLGSGTILAVGPAPDGDDVLVGDALLSVGDLAVGDMTIHVVDGFLTELTDRRGDG